MMLECSADHFASHCVSQNKNQHSLHLQLVWLGICYH